MTEQANQILIVDDDKNIRSFLAIALDMEGYKTHLANNGQEALDKLEDPQDPLHPDLVITDMRMPIMGGAELSLRLKLNGHSDLPIIIMSANMDAQKICREVGAEGYLSKPFNIDQMLDMVNRILRFNPSERTLFAAS